MPLCVYRTDPYDKSMMNRYLRQSRMSRDGIPLQKTALETMYDDDDMMGTAHTMPWFDSTYLAEEVMWMYMG